ncbi:hypothetical protein A9Q81_16660 [Gammaproteobacteria bacterium 42_54_T18]|nr:hypothetical protein A9Q81_16660 [Gammaproteobacteria bacterium 42_54_T18]
MNKPLLIIGGGGHASVLVDILRQQKREILGIVSPDMDVTRKVFQGIRHYSNDDDILNFESDSIMLVNGIGSLPYNNLREKIYRKFNLLGYEFETVVASNAIVSDYVILGEGVQIITGAIVQVNVRIGSNTIVNTGTIVEHDCNIGENNHIAPGVTLSGQVVTCECVHIGSGATVIQNVRVGANSVVAAGAVLGKNLQPNTTHFPAKPFQKIKK